MKSACILMLRTSESSVLRGIIGHKEEEEQAGEYCVRKAIICALPHTVSGNHVDDDAIDRICRRRYQN
jgi:hypothetical protein